ncbi:glutamine amidotransferase [Alphaproteobacteria bacterium]|nr:glutamine amidotransferase [Alphaproteobacteria bacterium]
MCGIVGLYLKKKNLHEKLGFYLSRMIDNMSSRGPDSAGFAIYNNSKSKNLYKYSLSINNIKLLNKFEKEVCQYFKVLELKNISDHTVVLSTASPNKFIPYLQLNFDEISLVGYGKSIEIFKQVGNPKKIVKKFKLENFSGSHGIGHTRMATESAITVDGSHPYSTGEDECLVHNGSLSNHNNLRRQLIKKGKKFNSLNDTEVAAGYISQKISDNISIKDTLSDCLSDLDGFYTFILGTNKGFAVLRDKIACKPAVIAENNDYVAVASEFQAMAHLPNVNKANIYEPEPGVIYKWGN